MTYVFTWDDEPLELKLKACDCAGDYCVNNSYSFVQKAAPWISLHIPRNRAHLTLTWDEGK